MLETQPTHSNRAPLNMQYWRRPGTTEAEAGNKELGENYLRTPQYANSVCVCRLTDARRGQGVERGLEETEVNAGVKGGVERSLAAGAMSLTLLWEVGSLTYTCTCIYTCTYTCK